MTNSRRTTGQSDRGGEAGAREDGVIAAVVAELRRRLAEPLGAGLYLVATPIGNLGDMTLRGLAALTQADLVYCEDTRHSRMLLGHFGIERHLRPYHEHNAEGERPRLIKELAAGRSVALISDAGTPLISDPGYKLVREVIAAGHAVTVLPGASAVTSAIAVAGLPTDQFHFAGFLPAKDGQRREKLAQLREIPGTLVLFEAPNRVAATLAAIAAVLGARRPVVVARELTKRFEEVRRGSAEDLAAWSAGAAARGEVVILIGPGERGEVDDASIAGALEALIGEVGLKEASKQVAARLGVARSRVYAVGLGLKAGGT